MLGALCGTVGIAPGQLRDFRVQANSLVHQVRRGRAWLVLDDRKLRLKERPFFVDLEHLKAFDSAGEDIHSAVVIALRNFDDLSRAADVRDSIGRSSHYAKRFLFIQTLRDHFLVAWLK